MLIVLLYDILCLVHILFTHSQAASLTLSPGVGMKPAPTGVAPASRSPSSSGPSAAIPLSPPIPTVAVTPSPAKTPLHTSTHSHISTPSTLTASGGGSSPPRPKKTGSLALFYRKVYLMAHLRIKDLCERLDQSRDFQQK